MSTFRVGQRVVCVDAESRTGRTSGLVHGRIYKILELFTCKCGRQGVCVDTEHMTTFCRTCHHLSNKNWNATHRFRPLLDSALEEQVDELEEQTVEA